VEVVTAKQRWATFSVADQKDIVHLIPDILTFDKLVFPYPRDEEEWEYWKKEDRTKQDWNPELLDQRLRELGELAEAFAWGEPERTQYRTRLAAVRGRDALEISPAASAANYEEAAGRSRWEIAKQATRDTVGAMIKRDDCWLLPRYGSLAAWQAERSFDIPTTARDQRRARRTVLLGQEFALPSYAKAETAYNLAIELAKKPEFQAARRTMNKTQELTILQEQSAKDERTGV
jgi:hypothetical protein